MKKVSKWFLLAAITACALLTALGFGLDWYVNSSGLREQLETLAQQQTGAKVKIGGLRFGLWSGLRATNISVTADTTGPKPASLSLPSVSVSLAYRPLLSGSVAIKELTFQEPELVLMRNASGGWDLPVGKPAPKQQPPKSAPTQATPEPKPAEPRPKGFQPEFQIQILKVENARIRLLEKDGKPFCALDGLAVKATLETPANARGTLAVASVKMQNGLALEAFRTQFTFDNTNLKLSSMEARLAGGNLTGSAAAGTAAPEPPFTLDLRFDGVEINRLMAALGTGGKQQKVAGTLHGNIDLHGRGGNPKSIGGSGQVRIRGARMEQIPLVQMIASALQMDVKDLELRQGQLDFRVAEEKLFVDSLVLEATDIRLTAKGTSTFDGRLDLATRLALQSKMARRLPGWINGNFKPVPGGDWRDIGFAVNGTVAKPQTNLLQVLVGQKLENEFMNLLQSVTGKQKKK